MPRRDNLSVIQDRLDAIADAVERHNVRAVVTFSGSHDPTLLAYAPDDPSREGAFKSEIERPLGGRGLGRRRR